MFFFLQNKGRGTGVITIDVRHDGLGRFARVAAPLKALAERRATALSKRWDETVKRREALLSPVASADTFLKLDAAERTKDAEAAASALTAILFSALQQTASPTITGTM